MDTLANRLSTAVVRASSPDGSVRAVLHGTDGLTLSFAPGAVAGHSEAGLAAQIGAVVSAARRGYRQGAQSLVDAPEPEPGGRWARFYAEIARIRATGRSPRGHVSVTWRGDDGAAVTIARDRGVRLTAAELLDEVNAAVRASRKALAEALIDVHARVFGPPGPRDPRRNRE